MTDTLRIGEVRIKATGLDEAGARALAAGVASSLTHEIQAVGIHGRLSSVRLWVRPEPRAGVTDLGRQIAGAILRSLR